MNSQIHVLHIMFRFTSDVKAQYAKFVYGGFILVIFFTSVVQKRQFLGNFTNELVINNSPCDSIYIRASAANENFLMKGECAILQQFSISVQNVVLLHKVLYIISNLMLIN